MEQVASLCERDPHAVLAWHNAIVLADQRCVLPLPGLIPPSVFLLSLPRSAWPLIDLPTSMMDAARQAVKDGGGTKYLLEWYVQKAQPAAAAGPVSTPANKRKKKTKKQ